MSTRSLFATLMLMTLGLWLGGCQASGGGSMGMGDAYSIEGQTMGNDAALMKAGTQLITTQAEYDALGANALAAKVNPDFAVDSLVITTMGEKAGHSCKIDGIQLDGSTLWVQVTRNKPAEGQAAGATHAYSAVVIPKVPAGTNAVAENTSATGQ
jgi:hypothetical protein